MNSPYRFATSFGRYELSDVRYNGRPARVLYSGNHEAAQSGVAIDDKPELLFDYNERFMELARGYMPGHVLIIGGGAYTLAIALLQLNPRLVLDIVEPDAELEDIAKHYFGYKPTKQTRSFAMGGAEYLSICTNSYDMVVVDAFNHDQVPEELQTKQFAKDLKRILTPKGFVAMNIISAAAGRRSALLDRICEAFGAVFSNVKAYPAEQGLADLIPQNFILCAGANNPGQHLRYPAY